LAYIGKTPTPAPLTSSDITNGIVTGEKLNADVISSQTELATAPADTDEFLISDAGVLKRLDASLVGGGGITEADMFRLSATISGAITGATITSNLERSDDATFSKIGTGMSESSGIFTFPSTGLYQITYTLMGDSNGTVVGGIQVSSDSGSNYDEVARIDDGDGGGYYHNGTTVALVNVTNATNFRVKFYLTLNANSNAYGNTNYNATQFMFIRLGDSQ